MLICYTHLLYTSVFKQHILFIVLRIFLHLRGISLWFYTFLEVSNIRTFNCVQLYVYNSQQVNES